MEGADVYMNTQLRFPGRELLSQPWTPAPDSQAPPIPHASTCPSTHLRLKDREKGLWLPREKGLGEGLREGLGLADAN